MNYQDDDYFPDEYVINDDQANYDGFNGEEEAMETDDKKSLKTPKTVKKSPKKRRPSRSTPKLIGHSTTYYESDNEDKEDPDFHEDDSDFEEPDDSDDDFDPKKKKTKSNTERERVLRLIAEGKLHSLVWKLGLQFFFPDFNSH